MARKQKLYMVQRLAWYTDYNKDLERAVCDRQESPEGVPVKAFDTRAKATNHSNLLTTEARRELNPFQFTYHHVTELMDTDEKTLLAAVAELGWPLPTPQLRSGWASEFIDWPAWYDEIADTLTDEERDAIWDLLDRLELYRVVEVEFFL